MQIDSGDLISDIEQNFRVSAGPGAGKTYWLVQHIKNVLHNSKRLGKTRKIACITYTNVAVETILERLGETSEHVEVSTIHSFLYKHVVKPYASFIADDYELDVAKMDGHDDTILSGYKFIAEWKARTIQNRIREDEIVIKAFNNIKWRFDANNNLIINTDFPFRIGGYAIKKTSYLEYKKMTWRKGILHHDDVLFFSYQIINKFPFVLNVLRAKFPYFFVDEFQDSNPIQVAILEKISQVETIVGIIGDVAQSIYGFQGAVASQLSSFSLNGMENYEIFNNRRSTNNIIDVLNIARKDMIQLKYRDIVGIRPVVFVGDREATYHEAQKLCKNENIYSLSRDNMTSNAMRKDVEGKTFNKFLLKELYLVDSNSPRKKLVIACIKAGELAKEKKYKDAIKEFAKYKIEKKEALDYLNILLSNYDDYKKGTLFDFYFLIKSKIAPKMTKVTGGRVKIFYDGHKYQELALCVNIPEDISLHKTIHKSKGDEFDNVMLVLKDEKDLNFILKPNLVKEEEYRVNYVAISRAKEKLFISVPTLSDINRNKIKDLFDIQDV